MCIHMLRSQQPRSKVTGDGFFMSLIEASVRVGKPDVALQARSRESFCAASLARQKLLGRVHLVRTIGFASVALAVSVLWIRT